MKPKYAAIDLSDYYALLAVWELQGGYWQLQTITRLRRAIALARESPLTRLVFPTGVSPNGVWGGIYKNRAPKMNQKKGDSLPRSRKKVLALLKASPGQSRDSVAEQLGLSVATVKQLLRKLENSGDIHHRPHPSQHKTKLYYAGSLPTSTSTGDTSSSNMAVPDARPKPPLKIYFVDPRTLQPLNQ